MGLWDGCFLVLVSAKLGRNMLHTVFIFDLIYIFI